MAHERRSVLLHFGSGGNKKEELRGQLSAVVQVDKHLWVGSDEMNSVERLSETEPGVYGEHRIFSLSDYLDLPGPEDEEIDIEGVDVEDGYLWLVGSHGLKRRKAKPGGNTGKQIQRLAEVRADGNRYLLARVPLVQNDEGDWVLSGNEQQDGQDHTRHASRLMGGDRGNLLMDALRLDNHLASFLVIPGKDNGLDIEGLAVRGGRIFLGLRGPVLRGWAVVLQIRVEEAAPGFLRLAPVDKQGNLYHRHFLDLRGLGVRDLCFHRSDLLVLAGPTMDLDGPAAVYRWPNAARADRPVLLGKDDLEQVLEVPYGTGEHDACDHPEGLTLFAADGGKPDELLVVYDSPGARRLRGKGGVRADVFPLKHSSD
jgi:hypothetical protein